MQHQRPAAEHLFGEEFGEADELITGRARASHVIVGIAVQHERGRRSREIELGQLLRPRRAVCRHALAAFRDALRVIGAGHEFRRHVAIPVADPRRESAADPAVRRRDQ